MTAGIRILAAVLISAFIFPISAGASNIIIYGTNYSDYYNISLTPIGASPSGYLIGLDYSNEWVEYKFIVTDTTANIANVYVAATLNTSYHLQMTVTEDGTSNVQTFDFHFTGQGFG